MTSSEGDFFPCKVRVIESGPTMTGDDIAAILARAGGETMEIRGEGGVLIAAFRCIDALERRIRELETAQFRLPAGQVPEGRETD